ncbi:MULTISPECIES: substrate-binding periplasmic protein [unclassified Agarivorans]|uniref:substrate-binding periplasmic protein n=1 Tax=unclassified Agarivorans TaxID=2636026 RepID=UPI0026E2301F|nr:MULTISPECIES: transporter substrate-binding domain-containing protein [unclassified Agarivorans]MDO6686538.1 transporter substrate-binding domain-containing protein [Agarivorans sp. 3_MG-2023]MDO6715356.1 transporter substrate-binding domain-containing protein [Agarivorans sp. 2_MG-2023]MDO6763327.1 transporter substrate-binding domain-containing protein [Agarivorans sp. 1_MG-2023]
MRLLGCLFYFCSFIAMAAPLAPAKFSSSMMKPWGYQDAGQPAQGLLVNFARKLCEEADIAMENSLKPYPRVIKDIQAGTADFAVMFAGATSEDIAVDLGPVVELKVMAVAKAGSAAIANIDALAGQRVGVIRGSIYGPEIDDNPSIDRISFNDTVQGIQMLLLGRIDVMIATNYSIDFALKQLHADIERLTPIYQLATRQGHLYWSKQSLQQEQAARLRNALERLREQGVLSEIFSIDASLALTL